MSAALIAAAYIVLCVPVSLTTALSAIAAAYIVLCWKVASLVGRFIDQMGGPDDE